MFLYYHNYHVTATTVGVELYQHTICSLNLCVISCLNMARLSVLKTRSGKTNCKLCVGNGKSLKVCAFLKVLHFVVYL